MSVDLPELKRINATGNGDQDLRDAEGGNNSRGVLGNVRPTGIQARNKASKSRELGKRS